MPGYQVRDVCYPTLQQAAETIASSEVGRIVTHAGNAYTVHVTSVTNHEIHYLLQPMAGGAQLTSNLGFLISPCNLPSLADGMQIGWMVASVWIAVFCVLFITKALRGETGESYGTS